MLPARAPPSLRNATLCNMRRRRPLAHAAVRRARAGGPASGGGPATAAPHFAAHQRDQHPAGAVPHPRQQSRLRQDHPHRTGALCFSVREGAASGLPVRRRGVGCSGACASRAESIPARPFRPCRLPSPCLRIHPCNSRPPCAPACPPPSPHSYLGLLNTTWDRREGLVAASGGPVLLGGENSTNPVEGEVPPRREGPAWG